MALVRKNQEENFNLKSGTKFVICSVDFEGVKRGSLPSIWKKGEPKKKRESRKEIAA